MPEKPTVNSIVAQNFDKRYGRDYKRIIHYRQMTRAQLTDALVTLRAAERARAGAIAEKHALVAERSGRMVATIIRDEILGIL